LAAEIGAPAGWDTTDWVSLARAEHLNARLMFQVGMLCDMFFWVGWHARGAVEEAEQLKRLAE